MKHFCPMRGEQWDEDSCISCGWREGKTTRYAMSAKRGQISDKRMTGEGAIKGWVTRRRKAADRRVALDRLIEVADSITSELVVGERATKPGKYVVGALTLINWRDRITSALRILEPMKACRVAGGSLNGPSRLGASMHSADTGGESNSTGLRAASQAKEQP